MSLMRQGQCAAKQPPVHTFFLPGPSRRIALTRLRLLMTSVLREIGRGRPCSLRNKPQALHRTEPYSSRRHSGVIDVLQFWQDIWEEALEAIMAAARLMGYELR